MQIKDKNELTEKILSRWVAAMTQEGMRVSSNDPEYAEYIKQLKHNRNIINLMARELVGIINQTVEKELEEKSQRVRAFVEAVGEEETTFMGKSVPVAETWINFPRDIDQAVQFSEKLPTIEKTAYIFTPDPKDEHLHGYFCGKINGEWETVIIGSTFWARYNKKLTYDEVKQIIIGTKEIEAIENEARKR